jgi:hypothetical protein
LWISTVQHLTASALLVSPYAFLNFIPNLHFYRDNQQSVALKSLWPSFLENSSDLLFSIWPQTRTSRPVMIEGASSTSESLHSHFRFREGSSCPWRNVHSSHRFSCCCIVWEL